MSIRTTAAIYASMGLIPTVLPVLQPIRDNLTTEAYLAMTDAEFQTYLDAQDYGDDDD